MFTKSRGLIFSRFFILGVDKWEYRIYNVVTVKEREVNNMELKEAIDKLFEMTDEQRYELFEYTDVEDILNTYVISAMLNIIEDFYSDPKYGDVYVLDDSILSKKCVFLTEDSDRDKYWLLFNNTDVPQQYSKSGFKRCYVKTGKNVADKLKGLFE